MPEQQIVRPGLGTAGTKIRVTVNAYKVALPSIIVHHYDLAVQGIVSKHGVVGDVPPSLGREIFSALKAIRAFGDASVVYDGRKTMFSPKLLPYPDNKQAFDVNLASDVEKAARRDRSFKVVVTKVSEVKLDNLIKYVKKQVGSTPDEGVYTAITALNVLCNHDSMMTHPNAKNKFFPKPPALPPNEKSSASILKMRSGIDMWRGYFSSIRMAPDGVILNFDLTSQPMLKSGNLALVAAEVAGVDSPHKLRDLKGAQLTHLIRMLKMMKVSVRRIDKTLLKSKIKDVGPSAKLMTFDAPVSPDSDKMKKWNVADYIEYTYNMKLKGPDLPVVKLTAKGWYPIELCEVDSGQKFSKKLSPDQLSDAIRWLTVKPQDRTQMLTEGIRNHVKISPSIAKWGVHLDPAPMIIPARRLAPPLLNYKGPNPQKPLDTTRIDNGAWNMANKKLLKPVVITNWMAVAFPDQGGKSIHPQAAAKALEGLQFAMKAVGIQASGLQGPTIFASSRDPLPSSDSNTVATWIMSKTKSKPQLIICFLKEKNAWEYRQLKLFGDSLQGIATQCMAVDKVTTKGNAQYYANVTLKINVKLGGVNHGIGNAGRIFQTRTMVLGADVTHPGADSLEPSIAGIVGSTNEFGGGYAAEFSVQPGRQEIITDLHLMVKELLIKFVQRNTALPQRLIFYRDGVSEGQFPDVVAKEIPLVRQAMVAVGENAKYKAQADAMKLTYIICGKRHHFKFGPTRETAREDGDRNGNLLPGVIIDTTIVHPFDFDWYGLSHAGLLGTSRASHYTVLVDDTKHKPDDLQTLTYHLCYTYARATRSVSIATPAYYAHHVCTRIKQMLSGIDVRQSSASPTNIDVENALREYQMKATEIRANFRSAYQKAGNNPVNEYWM